MQLLLTALLAFLAFTTLTAAQFPDCLPTDVVCRVQKSQYTVLGTVVSVTSNTTASDYNATVLIQCVYASVDPTVNTGANIIGQQVLITGFGPARAGCPSNTGATVKVGTSYIFFLFVSNSPPQNGLPVLSVFDICTGGIAYTGENMGTLGSAIAGAPQIAITGSNRGPGNCTVPNMPAPSSPSGSPTPSPSPLDLGLSKAVGLHSGGLLGIAAVTVTWGFSWVWVSVV